TEVVGADIDPFGLIAPSGIAVAGSDVAIADTGNHRIVMLTHYGEGVTYYGWFGFNGTSGGFFPFYVTPQQPLPGSGDLMFDTPMGLGARYDASTGQAWLGIADLGNARAYILSIFSQTGAGWIGADDGGGRGWHNLGSTALPAPAGGQEAFVGPADVAIGPRFLAVSDATEHEIEVYVALLGGTFPTATFYGTLGGFGTDVGRVHAPTGLLFVPDGGLWVCDRGNGRLQKFAPPHGDSYSVVPPEYGNVILGGDVPFASAALQIDSPDGGLLIPRMTEEDLRAIPAPVEGLLVYAFGDMGYGSKSDPFRQGFYFWNGAAWERVGALSYGEVRAEHIDYAAVQSYHLAEDAVQNVHLADNAVTGAEILDASIPDSKLQTIATPNKVDAGAVELKPKGGIVADAAGLALDPSLLPTVCPQIVNVCAPESIQAAIDAILDASAARPYLIRVSPGVFAEKLVLKSHVDIEGAGIGKTVILSAGGAALDKDPSSATVTAAAIANAGLRHLTIEARRSDNQGQLTGLFYGGLAGGRGLHLLHVEIRVTTLGYELIGGAWGIEGATSAASGLILEHVRIAVDAGPGAGAAVYGIQLQGELEMTDCTVAANSTVSGRPAYGIRLGLRAAPVRFHNVTASIDSNSTTTQPGAALEVQGTGSLTLTSCCLRAKGSYAAALRLAGDPLVVRAQQTSLWCESAMTPLDLTKARVEQGRLELHHCSLMGPGNAISMVDANPSELFAFYCPMQGYRNDIAGTVARYVRCVELDSLGNPYTEVHSTLP
ncbi:MAG: hypothetical protein JXR77_18555, partial [Lentisphaeria bacterium]|nr:hypothetical protein [Lentisphaeria bacterium]